MFRERTLMVGPIGRPETSVRNYFYSMCNIAEGKDRGKGHPRTVREGPEVE